MDSFEFFLMNQRIRCQRAAQEHLTRVLRIKGILRGKGLPAVYDETPDLQVIIRGSVGSDCHAGPQP